jgi:hypothetical protein
MQGGPRLALRGAEVRLQPPPVAAIGIAVAVQGRQNGGGAGSVRQQLEAATVQDTRVRGHERIGRGKVHVHALIVPPHPATGLVRISHLPALT